ncbi:MAG: carbohydrate binding family 9 domain-containing protein [Pseudomonadota bacterium]
MHYLRLVLLSSVLVQTTLAQTPSDTSLAAESAQNVAVRKSVEIARTELAPKLDGILDDEIWTTATVISDMHQFQPVDQGQPTERTEFYLAYSERFLYIGARMFDSDPSGISARQLVQGQGMQFDDAFEFILDTFNNGRTGYQFQVNPNGIRREGVYENPNNLNNDWTGIWQVESRIDEQGWTAEVAIPFNTLNFDPTTEEWGFTIARTIARKREELAWSSFNRNINPTTTGLITGIRDIRQGVGLDIIPSIALAASEDHIKETTDNRIDPSLNVFYKITPNLTGAVTFNTDFSATEVDNRQVNLSRFSLFFPEKRDFFLQDVDIFSFGGRGGGGGGFGNNQNGIPFYSRRIGLSNTGQPVDIDAGVKLTGRVGQFSVGALAVQQGESANLDAQNVFVGRASANVLGESAVGVIFTSGNPTGVLDNSLVGTDFRYQNTRFSETHTLRGDAYYQQTDTQGLNGDDKAYGVSMNLDTQNNGFGGSAGYNYFGEQYNPALGFANRVGIESFNIGGSGRYFVQDHPLIRTLNSFMRYEYNRDLETGELQSENLFWRPLNINTHIGDQVGFGAGRNREGLEQDFQISPGIFIPAGKYSFTELNAEINLSNQRNFSPGIQLNTGEFYNGDRDRARIYLDWRPDEHLFLSFNYDFQKIELPAGNFDVRLVSANANYAFNSKWSWVNLVQYDNNSSTVGLNSRLRWNPQAGEDLYIVLNYNFDSEGVFSHLSSEKTEIALKYTKTFRY